MMREQMDAQQALEQLATSLGIEPFFYDIWGKRYDVSPELKDHIIRAMGFAPPWTEALERFLQEQNPATPPVVVWTGLVLPELELCLPASVETINWRIEAEDGTPYKGQASLEKICVTLGRHRMVCALLGLYRKHCLGDTIHYSSMRMALPMKQRLFMVRSDAIFPMTCSLFSAF